MAIEFSSVSVLIVDDRAEMRMTVRAALAGMGILRVLEADSGLQAIDRLTMEGAVNLVILDLTMPKMNGMDFLSWLKEQPALQNIPVIMLTAHDDFESVGDAHELGVAAYLVKPFRISVLQDTVDNVLREQAGSAQQ